MRSASSSAAIAAAALVFACLGLPAVPVSAAVPGTAATEGVPAAPDAGTAAAGAAEVAATVKAILGPKFSLDWRGVEALRAFDWTPLPPKMLQDCLPDGGCFVRQGTAQLGGRTVAVLASGARGFVSHVYLRNPAEPFGEAALLAALRQAGLAPVLARCPAAAAPGRGTGGTSWYRVAGKGLQPGVVSIQTSCNGRPCEGFSVSPGPELPPLQPHQLALYSEQCSAEAAGRRAPVATSLPHEQLAALLVALLPRASGPALPGWQALAGLAPGVRWAPRGAGKGSLAHLGETDPWMHSGEAVYGGRRYSLLASGTPTQVRTVRIEEGGLHARGEDVLGLLRRQGLAVELVRCGPVYTESVNDWWRVSGGQTRPVMLRQSLRRDGTQVQDSYELRLDASLPKRDPRDRDPGTAGCAAR